MSSLYASLYLRVGWDDGYAEFLPVLNRHILLCLILRIGCFFVLGIYDIIWRYISFSDALRLFQAIGLSSVLIIASSYLVELERLPRAVFLIDAILAAILLGGIRFVRRFVFEVSTEAEVRRLGRKTLIYGAGFGGRTLASRFNTDSKMGFSLVGFIDDDPQKVGRSVAGVKVLGTRKEFAEIFKAFQIKELIVAISQISGSVLREILPVCRSFGIRPRLMATPVSGMYDNKAIEVTREIELNDLLSRPRREIDFSSIRSLIEGRRVLVTGAGGSIGSELARQILRFDPSRLLLLDHSEFNLYQIDHELRLSPNETGGIIPLLATIKDRSLLADIFQEHSPEIVFHAAAYKHVHLVETNPFSSILNNILGTRNLIELSIRHGVNTFVLISTDKAVNPVGIMGASKRVCELMVSQAGVETGRRFCSVRFGNVLGSSGSLIPLLQRQIERGEPVTVTHPDMARYFMLIPEAVSLVLKAATIAHPSDIAILRMGDSVKIVDVAKSLIALMGKTENEIPIVFTGVRPGEKLFEELYLCGNEIQTDDPDIFIAPSGDSPENEETDFANILKETIDRMIELSMKGDREAVQLMNALIKPGHEIQEPLIHTGKTDQRKESIYHPGEPVLLQ